LAQNVYTIWLPNPCHTKYHNGVMACWSSFSTAA